MHLSSELRDITHGYAAKSIFQRDIDIIKGSLKQNRYQLSKLVRGTGVEPANVCTTGP